VAWPPQGIYSKKPLASAADLKGIKWRAYSPATSRIAELVGAQPVTVQAAELSQAFATGVVEATMTSGASGVDSKLYEHLKYWYDTQAWLPKNAVIVNKKAFDALDKPTQAVVLKAAADAEARGLAASKRDQHRIHREAQGQRHADRAALSAQLKADMKKVGDTMLKEWLDKGRCRKARLVDAFQASPERRFHAQGTQ
jgi:TRAP-type C4-dicarboxylate transport system substrate-binding protein